MVFEYPRVVRYPKCGLCGARYPLPPSHTLSIFRLGWTTMPLRIFCRYAHPERREDSHHRQRKPPYVRIGAEQRLGCGVSSDPRRKRIRHHRNHRWGTELPSNPATYMRDILASRNLHLLSRSYQHESHDLDQFDSPANLETKTEWIFWKLANTYMFLTSFIFSCYIIW